MLRSKITLIIVFSILEIVGRTLKFMLNASYAKSDSVIKNGLRYHAATTIKRDAMDLIRHTRFWRVIGAHLIVSVRSLLKVGREEEEKGEEVCGERRGRGRKRRGKGGRDERKRER